MIMGEIWMPKYFKEVTVGMGHESDTDCPGALSNSINADLVQLIVRPECCPKSVIMDITLVSEEEVSPKNSNISAYSMIFSCKSPY